MIKVVDLWVTIRFTLRWSLYSFPLSERRRTHCHHVLGILVKRSSSKTGEFSVFTPGHREPEST